MLKTQFRSLGQEDPLEKEMATHSSNLAWKICGAAELDTTEGLHFHFSLMLLLKLPKTRTLQGRLNKSVPHVCFPNLINDSHCLSLKHTRILTPK